MALTGSSPEARFVWRTALPGASTLSKRAASVVARMTASPNRARFLLTNA